MERISYSTRMIRVSEHSECQSNRDKHKQQLRHNCSKFVRSPTFNVPLRYRITECKSVYEFTYST
ncbi:hypothetical protein T4D_6920 [Trichinella pseudospiralis]|uniref:Uncharacterized protein n=1 Tax=Trichinella pseudospiralis TaxID=6337 RepID=A0A0V1FW46_TRIPS|nr:hypothetical protein T4D_6920 [Trichinella pseudospiralis]